MDGWEIFYGVLTVGVVLLSVLSRCPGVRRAAGFIFCTWTLYITLQRTMQPHDLAPVFAHIDLIAIVFGMSLKGKMGRKRHSPYVRWIWVFIACHAVDLSVHTWFSFAPFEQNYFYYAGLNLNYVVTLAAIATPSLGYYWRMWKRHRRRRPVFVNTETCAMRRSYCGKCGPLGVRCEVTGRITARWGDESAEQFS
jgi:hypothetical protein